MTVLVTGGAGFIGANLVRELERGGTGVRVLDDFSVGRDENLKGTSANVFRGSISRPDNLDEAFAGCDCCVHLAAMTSVVGSVHDPWPGLEINVAGTVRMLTASAAAGVRTFVFASSNAALGDYEPPLDESRLPMPISPYGASKLAAEAYCHAFARVTPMRVVILRFSNAYGRFMSGKDSVVPRFIRAALAGDDLVIYGDGSQTRDFVNVSDIVRAIDAALAISEAKGVFQIATGRETKVAELAQLIVRECGSSSKIRFEAGREGEIYRNSSNIAKAQRVLGFEPKVTLQQGISETVSWFRSTQSRLS